MLYPKKGDFKISYSSNKKLSSKRKQEVEELIDVFKNLYEADVSYMQDEQSLEGWMFINHIVLQWHYKMVQLLTGSKLSAKYSVEDMLSFLREIRKLRINESWFIAEIPEKYRKILQKIGLHII